MVRKYSEIVQLKVESEVKEENGVGYADDIKVAVIMAGDEIVVIEVKESSDTSRIVNPAIEQLTKKIIETQSTKVDTIDLASFFLYLCTNQPF